MFPPVRRAEHGTSGRTCPHIDLLVLRGINTTILCSGSPIKFRISREANVFATCLRGYPSTLVLFRVVSCPVTFSETDDRSYSRKLLDAPLVLYSRRWAVTCSPPRGTRFRRRHNRSRGGYGFRSKGGQMRSKGGRGTKY